MSEDFTRANRCAGALDLPEPTIGNYFVSTYPPFSCWTRESLDAFREALRRSPKETTTSEGEPARAASVPDAPGSPPLGLYVHVPFCLERCTYCYYLSHDDRPGDVGAYVDALHAELEHYARAPALLDRPIDFVYFGGGTPSLLSSERVRALLEGMQRVLPWSSAREVTFECAPKSVTRRKLSILRELGVTRVSLGVQQLDDDILARNGRIHRVADVLRAYDEIRSVGFDVVNLDLIAGLVGQTDATFSSSLEALLELRPESVTVYALEIPHNTPLYRAMREGRLDDPPASWEVKRARLRTARDRVAAAGYTWRSAYCAVRDPSRHPFRYQDELYHGADLIGIGASAFSYLQGVNQQNDASIERYVGTLADGSLPLGRAYALDELERAVRELVLQLKLGRVDREPIRRKYGIDILDHPHFREPIRELTSRGWIEADDHGIGVTPEGLLRVDRWLTLFYLPRHRGIRYT
jgi:oxygen-independent coproporphyrinogen-3 oxidase